MKVIQTWSIANLLNISNFMEWYKFWKIVSTLASFHTRVIVLFQRFSQNMPLFPSKQRTYISKHWLTTHIKQLNTTVPWSNSMFYPVDVSPASFLELHWSEWARLPECYDGITTNNKQGVSSPEHQYCGKHHAKL